MDSNDKIYGVLSYIAFLWIVGLLASKSEFSKFHANQGLVLFIAELIIGVISGVLSFIPIIGTIVSILCGLLGVVCLVLAIIGIVNAAQGEMKPLPVIGGITIIK